MSGRVCFVPFVVHLDPKGRLIEKNQGMYGRMIPHVLSDRLGLLGHFNTRVNQFIVKRRGLRCWLVASRMWSPDEAIAYGQSQGKDVQFLVDGKLCFMHESELQVRLIDLDQQHVVGEQIIVGENPFSVMRDGLGYLSTLLGTQPNHDQQIRMTQFGTQSWEAFSSFLWGKSNVLSHDYDIHMAMPEKAFIPFIDAIEKDMTFEAAAEGAASLAVRFVVHNKGPADAAMEALYEVSSFFPEHPIVWMSLGDCHKSLGDVGKAKDAFEKAFALSGDVYCAEQLAELSFVSGQVKESIRISEEVLSQDPEHVDMMDRLGVFYARAGQMDKALSLWEKVIGLDHERRTTYGNMGRLLEEMGKPREAREKYEEGLQIEDADPNLFINFTQFLLERSEDRRANEVFKKYVVQYGEDAWGTHELGLTYSMMGEQELASHYLEQCQGLDPHGEFGLNASWLLFGMAHPEASAELEEASRLVDQGVYDKAAKMVKKLLKTIDWWQVWYLQGVIQEHLENPEAAKEAFAKVLVQNPEQPETCHDLGVMLLQTGEVDEAARLLEMAIKHRDQSPEFALNLALCRISQQRFDEARKLLSVARTLGAQEEELASAESLLP